MAEYIDRTQIKWYGCDFEGGKACCKNQGDCSKCIHGNCDHDEVMNIPHANVVEREKIDKAIEEIEQKFDGCDICEWFENYDWDENDISEYQYVGSVEEILNIIRKHLCE